MKFRVFSSSGSADDGLKSKDKKCSFVKFYSHQLMHVSYNYVSVF